MRTGNLCLYAALQLLLSSLLALKDQGAKIRATWLISERAYFGVKAAPLFLLVYMALTTHVVRCA